jgi:hypothetical protein
MSYITVGTSSEMVINFLNDEGMETLEDIRASIVPSVTKVRDHLISSFQSTV